MYAPFVRIHLDINVVCEQLEKIFSKVSRKPHTGIPRILYPLLNRIFFFVLVLSAGNICLGLTRKNKRVKSLRKNKSLFKFIFGVFNSKIRFLNCQKMYHASRVFLNGISKCVLNEHRNALKLRYQLRL